MAEKENVITDVYDLLVYIIPQLAKFPRSQKFLLADRIQVNIMESLDMLIEAYYSKSRDFKKERLRKVNLQLEKLRYLIRLSAIILSLHFNGHAIPVILPSWLSWF